MGTNLDWDDNAESDLATYNLYVGTTSGVYDYHISVSSLSSSYAMVHLVPNTHYYFVVTAVDTSDNEGDSSSEITKQTARALVVVHV